MKTKKHAQIKRGTPKLKLEVGKHYKARDGRVAKIIRKGPGGSFPYFGKFAGEGGQEYRWREYGAYLLNNESTLDLTHQCAAPRSPRVSEPQGTFIKIWLSKAGKLSGTFHNGRAAAEKAKKKDCKLVGIVRHSRRKGLEVVS